jgi:hypothetical protein
VSDYGPGGPGPDDPYDDPYFGDDESWFRRGNNAWYAAIGLLGTLIVIVAIILLASGSGGNKVASGTSTSSTTSSSTTTSSTTSSTSTTLATTTTTAKPTTTTTAKPTTTASPPTTKPYNQLCPSAEACAGSLFKAWQTNDIDTAYRIANSTAVSNLFSDDYRASDGWQPAEPACAPADDGSTYCDWVNGAASETITIRVPNTSPFHVSEANRTTS